MSSKNPEVTESLTGGRPQTDESATLPDDLAEVVRALAEKFDESPKFIIISAVDHFTRIPQQQQKAVLKGTSIRRRGY